MPKGFSDCSAFPFLVERVVEVVLFGTSIVLLFMWNLINEMMAP